jgi:hypothetical protein
VRQIAFSALMEKKRKSCTVLKIEASVSVIQQNTNLKMTCFEWFFRAAILYLADPLLPTLINSQAHFHKAETRHGGPVWGGRNSFSFLHLTGSFQQTLLVSGTSFLPSQHSTLTHTRYFLYTPF